MVMDSKPFRDVHYILQDLNDDRIWVYAEWVRLTQPDHSACAWALHSLAASA